MDRYSCNDADLRKIQLMQLDALTEIDRTCRKRGWTYYLVAGTLLGAVRHGGFTPWDSDVDIAMFRADYNDFCRRANDTIDPKYYVHSDHVDPKYRPAHARVVIRNTRFVEKGNRAAGENSGFYVDVFPLDDIVRTPGRADKMLADLVRLLQRVKAFRNGKVHSAHRSRTLVVWAAALLTSWMSTERLRRLIDRFMTRGNGKGASFATNYCSRYGIVRQAMPKDYYGAPIEILFEGRKFCAPREHLKWLERIYGDFRKLPPENKRIARLDLYDYDLGPYGAVVAAEERHS
jgi:lipopolysaccharide cholinephosphotransferase